MDINIFPFVCKIYVVRCKFCNNYLGHLVTDRETYDPTDEAKENFSWCSPECCDQIDKAKFDYKPYHIIERIGAPLELREPLGTK